MDSVRQSFFKDISKLQIKQVYGSDKGHSASTGRFLRHSMHLLHTRYQILDERREVLATANEMKRNSSIPYFLRSYYIGPRRPMKISIRNVEDDVLIYLQRPFYFFTSTGLVLDEENQVLGSVVRRLDPVVRRYDFRDARNELIAFIKAPIIKPWTFPIYNVQGREIGKIKRLFPSVGEFMTYKETVNMEFKDMSVYEKTMTLSAALSLSIDLFGPL